MSIRFSPTLLAVTLAAFLGFSGSNLPAADISLDEKLQQCETAFKASRSKTATREEAAKARQNQFKPMVKILQDRNKQNVASVNQNKPLTPTQLTNNIRVMGHLIDSRH